MTMTNRFDDHKLIHDPNLEGVWGAIARRFPERGALAAALISELEEGLELLGGLPPAVTFFGGARIKRDDPYYGAAETMGEILAERGIPPRTGAGPGIMSAVPEGFRQRLRELGGMDETAAATAEAEASSSAEPNGSEPTTGRARMLSQGFNIRLPFEQSINPSIDVSLELTHFPTRKLVLWKNALGIVIFPGGFGTLDELLEVWRHKQRGRLNLPLVLFGRDFWGELKDGMRRASERHSRVALTKDDMRLLQMTDDPEETLTTIDCPHTNPPFPEDLSRTGRRMAAELVEALYYLESLRPAVTFLGGSLHEETDETIRIAESVAERLAREGVPTRAGGPGALSTALAQGGHRGAPTLPQQGFGMRRADLPNIYRADRVHIVEDRLTHKVLLTENARAFVALPGGLGTLDELFSILCQLQTRKIPYRRVVLIGPSFWEPIWETIANQMLTGARSTIASADLDMVTITDDPAEVTRLCLEPPKPPPAKDRHR